MAFTFQPIRCGLAGVSEKKEGRKSLRLPCHSSQHLAKWAGHCTSTLAVPVVSMTEKAPESSQPWSSGRSQKADARSP